MPLTLPSPPVLLTTAPPGLPSVHALELRSFNAWPAVQTALLPGWVLRSAGGYTKRANSANATEPGAPLDRALRQAVEAWYARQQQPAVFRLSPLAGAGVDAQLAAAGYAMVEPSHFLHRPVQPHDAALPTITVQPCLSDAWFQGCCQANAVAAAHLAWHRRVLECIGMPCGFASVQRAGQTVAWGMAVLEGDAAGVYDVVVHPGWRGQGLGRELVQGLLQWAATQGAHSVDLQVRGGNEAAQQLYASLGWQAAYGYHYRVQTQTRAA